ncbi:ferrous iron transport protein B [bacterium BMS3Abin02]|nr:ferrous iron transport protein B [bacterium BMS3Abin02]HDL49096.1 ferrous iron transport protein B [Actinomycetota bacterium]
MAGREVSIALAAIPNTGKTTLFNRLTGSNRKVGNWPGVSIQKAVGHFTLGEYDVELIDLPGSYSITPTSEEERIVREFFLNDPPGVILNILDARNLYRGLGFTLQMSHSGLPMVVAVNMMDEARRAGLDLDLEILTEHLGCPVIPVVARTGEGLPSLRQALYDTIRHPEQGRPPHVSWPPVVEAAVADLARKIERKTGPTDLDEGFLALRVLEGDTVAPLEDHPAMAEIRASAAEWRNRVEETTGSAVPAICAQCRFNSARGLVLETTQRKPPLPDALSEKLDRVLLHRWLGLPLFAVIMLIVFQGVYALGTPLQSWLASLFVLVGDGLSQVMSGFPQLLRSFIVDGLWQGLATVASFFPIILLFFLFMSIIEDSGYMARAAFLMDRLMHRLGLDGKGFINLLLGYGCNVPAVMGTRVLSGKHNRIRAMLLIPFTLCSARLQVFVFLSAILFSPVVAPWVVFALYLGSFGAVIGVGLLLKALQIAGPPEPFIMEIPPYRLPTTRTVGLRAGYEVKDFLYRAGTMITIGVVIVWLLTNLPPGVDVAGPTSYAGILGRAFEPLFHPLGIGWQETVALLFGFIAKEIVIGAFALIYGGDLTTQIAANITALQGISFMVFTLLYTPCVATIAAIRAEAHSWKVAAGALGLGLVIAWLAAFAVYQGGRLLGFS